MKELTETGVPRFVVDKSRERIGPIGLVRQAGGDFLLLLNGMID